MTPFERVLGVNFLNAGPEIAIRLLDDGGLMVVPAAPGLASVRTEPLYRDALVESDFALVDSAFMALLWLVLKRRRLRRVSGLEFLRALLVSERIRPPGTIFLVNPTAGEEAANLRLLQSIGVQVTADDCYTAPHYDRSRPIDDRALLDQLERKRPKYILLNIGGGIQEPLGLFLKKNLTYRPAIICTGAAIAFLTGRQAQIPVVIDRLGLGWLARCLSNPRTYVPRYVRALKLVPVLARFGENMPAVDARVGPVGEL